MKKQANKKFYVFYNCDEEIVVSESRPVKVPNGFSCKDIGHYFIIPGAAEFDFFQTILGLDVKEDDYPILPEKAEYLVCETGKVKRVIQVISEEEFEL